MPLPSDWPPFQAAIVDLDGTMVDTVGDFEVALNTMLAGLGLPPVGRAFIARTVGKGSEHLLRDTSRSHQWGNRLINLGSYLGPSYEAHFGAVTLTYRF